MNVSWDELTDVRDEPHFFFCFTQYEYLDQDPSKKLKPYFLQEGH